MSKFITEQTIKELPKIVTVKLRKLQTSDGLGQLSLAAWIGKEIRINRDSVRKLEVTHPNGIKKKYIVVDTVDENGKAIGWIYAEMVLPEDTMIRFEQMEFD